MNKTWFKKRDSHAPNEQPVFHHFQSALVQCLAAAAFVMWNGPDLLKGKKISFSEESETAIAVSKVQLRRA